MVETDRKRKLYQKSKHKIYERKSFFEKSEDLTFRKFLERPVDVTFDVLRKHGFLQHQFLNRLDQRLHLCWRRNVSMADLLH